MKTSASLRIAIYLMLMFVVCVFPSCGGGGSSSTSETPTLVGDILSPDEKEIKITQGDKGTPDIVDAPPYRAALLAPGTPPPQGAYAEGTINSYYTPANAFDRNFNTWWVGAVGIGSWDLYYGFAESTYIDQLSINFYGTTYAPTQISVKISTDGLNWTDMGAMPAGNSNPYISINKQIRYFWIDMDGNPGTGYPLIKDVTYTPPTPDMEGATGGPGQDDYLYQAAYAFDGNPEKIWVGAKSAGKWDLYYHFPQPQDIELLTVQFQSMNYTPATMTLYLSDDGINWDDAGFLGKGANTTPYNAYLFVATTTSYMRLAMQGNPASTFPLIKDITFTIPQGAFSGDSENSTYQAINAFDSNSGTWWVGDTDKEHWDLIYAYAADTDIKSILVQFYSVNHMPAATTLSCKHDASNWSQIGVFPSGANTTLNINANCKYLWFHMTSNAAYPAVGYPLIKDIAISVNTGIACSSDTECTDQDSLTTDTCNNPGTEQSACLHLSDSTNIPYGDMLLTFQLRMDGSVPANATLFIGDSITQSLSVAAVTEYGVNYGIGGDTTGNLLSRLTKYESRNRVQAVVIAVGVNDIARGVSTSNIVDNFELILAQIPQTTHVVLSAILPVDESLVVYNTLTNAAIIGVNAQARTLCQERGNCTFVDVGASLADASGAIKAQYHIGDGVHLNTSGYAIWINALSAAL